MRSSRSAPRVSGVVPRLRASSGRSRGETTSSGRSSSRRRRSVDPAQGRVVVAQRLRPAERDQAAPARRPSRSCGTPGSAAFGELAERDQELDVHDPARDRSGGGATRRGRARVRSRRARAPGAGRRRNRSSSNGTVEGDRLQQRRPLRAQRRRPRRCRRRARAAAQPAPSPPPRRGGSARTRVHDVTSSPCSPDGRRRVSTLYRRPSSSIVSIAEMNRGAARANHSRWSTPVVLSPSPAVQEHQVQVRAVAHLARAQAAEPEHRQRRCADAP